MSTRDENIAVELKFFDYFYSYRYPDTGSQNYEYDKAIRRQDVIDGQLQLSTFIENSVAVQAGLTRDSKNGVDLSDGSEVKGATSSFRENNIERGSYMHTYEIRNVHTKTGPLRVIGYNILSEQFEYYFIPNKEITHLKKVLTLPIETATGWPFDPPFTGIRSGKSKWHQFQINSFEDLCKLR